MSYFYLNQKPTNIYLFFYFLIFYTKINQNTLQKEAVSSSLELNKEIVNCVFRTDETFI